MRKRISGIYRAQADQTDLVMLSDLLGVAIACSVKCLKRG
jgi:hypothetical protein